jgi:hypothetical protein
MSLGISRSAFKVWLTCTILFWIATGIIINAGGFFPARYQANYPLQPNLPPFQKDAGWKIDDPLRKPLYEITRSPSAERLPIRFTWLGYQGPIWNQHIHSRKTERYEFASGETLDLPKGLTEADRQYVKDEFWNQRWSRWREIFTPYLKSAILVPLAGLAAIWGFRRFRTFVTGKEPEPEKPRLPYSPTQERLRKLTLLVSAAELLFWLAIAIVNDPKEPQPFFDLLVFLLPLYLPALAALVMSLLRRGPVGAVLLAGLGLYFIVPELAARFLPRGFRAE